MNTTVFTQQVEAMSDRLTDLYQGINTSSSPSSLTLLPLALKELGIASERLELAAEMLYQQNQKLSLVDQTVEASRQRYQALLEFIPDACLLTDERGVIQEANGAAAKLLNRQQSFLIGQSLTALVTPENRQQFQLQLQQLQQRPWKQEWQVRLQSERGVAFNVNVLVDISCQEANQPPTLRWLLRHPTGYTQSDSNAQLDYPVQIYPSFVTLGKEG